MYFLIDENGYQYTGLLFDVLLHYPSFGNAGLREAFMKSAGLSHLVPDLHEDHTRRQFAQWLFGKFTENWESGLSEEPWCVKVFVYMREVPDTLPPDDLRILKTVIDICQKKHQKKLIFQQEMDQIPSYRRTVPIQRRTALPRSRSHNGTYSNLNVREKIVTMYDLKPLIDNFCTGIKIGTASAFVFEYKEDFLREYIFKRTGKAFHEEIKQKPFHIDISLYQRALSPSLDLETMIEKEIMRLYKCETLTDLFITKHYNDYIVCTIWNHYLPASDMYTAVAAFWQKVQTLMDLHPQKCNSRMVLFLAHLPADNIQPLADSTPLSLPKDFTVKEKLFPWVKNHLSSINVSDDDIGLYLRRLDHASQPYEIFGELRHIADEVQENYNQGIYNGRRLMV